MNDAFAEILKIFLEFLLTKIEEKNAGDAFLIILGIIIIAIVFGFIIGWLLSKKKLKAEIKKINAEQKAQAIENYEKMQDYRKKYLESSILVQMATSDITKNLNNNAINEAITNKNSININPIILFAILFFILFFPFLIYIVSP